ncbi:MAG: penicillin acylase family protein [SAR324 cluster bacterium]|nr:penicillin acylase family protein [SAR324 cluster bacterium]
MFRKIFYGISLLALLVIAGGYGFLRTKLPQRSGEIKLSGLKSKVDVVFDKWGIPHIEAANEQDAYHALGYLNAQDRIFQLELMVRVAHGRLSEMLGESTLDVDRYFRTLGIQRFAKKYAAEHFRNNPPKIQKALKAYLSGLNSFVASGPTPIEFTLLGIPKREYSLVDLVSISAYMSYTFTNAVRQDPLVSYIHKKLGSNYLKDLAIYWPEGDTQIKVSKKDAAEDLELAALFAEMDNLLDLIPPFFGSNSWVVSGSRTKSGKVILANDPHIGYAAPATWYEAHLKTPDWELYGHHLAGIPFAILGHNHRMAWGVTMLQNDDLDYYREQANPENPDQVRFGNHWEDLKIIEETISVKGKVDVPLRIRISRHGPIINDVLESVGKTESQPVALAWQMLSNFENSTEQVFYELSHSESLADTQAAVSKLHAPGLNINYGDAEGNIAWWAAARLLIRPSHVNSFIILDGAGGRDEVLGYRDFSANPQAVNPRSGIVFNGNNQPGDVGNGLEPGYYAPEERAHRMSQLLDPDKFDWTAEDMRQIQLDTKHPRISNFRQHFMKVISESSVRSEVFRQAAEVFKNWEGVHEKNALGPTIFHRLFYHLSISIFADEIEEKGTLVLLNSSLIDKSMPLLLNNPQSPWWDNLQTPDKLENQQEILQTAWVNAVQSLEEDYGPDVNTWNWGRIHTLEIQHLLGRKKPLNLIFNIGPFAVPGSKGVINQIRHKYGPKELKVSSGPSTRRVIDFGDAENSTGISPTGQSGYFFDQHYQDQTPLYLAGKSRRQIINLDRIPGNKKSQLIFLP